MKAVAFENMENIVAPKLASYFKNFSCSLYRALNGFHKYKQPEFFCHFQQPKCVYSCQVSWFKDFLYRENFHVFIRSSRYIPVFACFPLPIFNG